MRPTRERSARNISLLKADALHHPLLPRVRHQRRVYLDREMVLEGPSAIGADPFDDAAETVAERDLRLVIEQASRLVRGACRVAHFARPLRHEDRMQCEVHQVRDRVRQFQNGDVFLVRADVDHLAGDSVAHAHLHERIDAILHEREAALLTAIAVDDGLLALEHPVDHDAGDVAIRIVVLLLGADDVVRHRDRVLESVRVGDVLHQHLGRVLGDAVGIDRLRLRILRERSLCVAVARHAGTIDEPANPVRCGSSEHRGCVLIHVLRDQSGRKDAEAFRRDRRAVIDEIRAGHEPLHRADVATVGLLELNALGQIGKLAAYEVVAAHDVGALPHVGLGEMTTEKTGRAGDEHLHGVNLARRGGIRGRECGAIHAVSTRRFC